MSASLHHKTPGERTEAVEAFGRVFGRSGRSDRFGAASVRQETMARAIEAEVVPRLVLRGRGMSGRPPAPAGWTPSETHVAELSRLCVARDSGAPVAFVDGLRAQGASLETLFLDLVAPAARRLGAQWEDDDLDFMQVTEGLGRLQRALHAFSPAFVGEVGFCGHGRRALLLPAPGEQHTFGLSMVGEFFRRDGWDVWTDPASDGADLLALLRGEWFALIGFSVLCDASLDALPGLIGQVRRESRNRGVGVMVGGPVFAAHPELAAMVGADATAADARQATAQARTMFTMLPGRD